MSYINHVIDLNTLYKFLHDNKETFDSNLKEIPSKEKTIDTQGI